MTSFIELSENINNSNFKEIYKIIADKYSSKGVKDASVAVNFTQDDLNAIQTFQFEEIKGNYAKDSAEFQDIETLKKNVVLDINNKIKNNYVKDGFLNPVTGIGTLNDPGQYNQAFTPVVMSPFEATSYYASRGINANIIDKKSKIPLMNGFQFVDGLDPDNLKKLTEHAQRKGFDKCVIEALRDGLIYGGSSITPIFNKDSFETHSLTVDELLKKGIADKDTIAYFFTADRWNMVTIPSYDITVKDYLMPDFFYIPLGSMKIRRERSAIIKPHNLPYWAAIRQLGWSTSDYEGYIRQLLGYNIIIASVPIMAQQMSLLLHEIPLDGIIAQNGAEYAEEFAKKNEKELAEWSMIKPKTVNSYGKVNVIERSYVGFSELIATYREDLSANSGIPVANFFGLQAKGMSADNEQDTTLKQSETIQMIETNIKPQLKPIIELLVIDCFGRNSEQAKLRSLVNIDFNSPVVVSNKEKGEIGLRWSQCLISLVNTGMPLDLAIKQLKQFFPDHEIDEEDLERLGTPSENDPPNELFGNLNYSGV